MTPNSTLTKIAEYLQTNVHPIPYSHEFALQRAQEILDIISSSPTLDQDPNPHNAPEERLRHPTKNSFQKHDYDGTVTQIAMDPEPPHMIYIRRRHPPAPASTTTPHPSYHDDEPFWEEWQPTFIYGDPSK